MGISSPLAQSGFSTAFFSFMVTQLGLIVKYLKASINFTSIFCPFTSFCLVLNINSCPLVKNDLGNYFASAGVSSRLAFFTRRQAESDSSVVELTYVVSPMMVPLHPRHLEPSHVDVIQSVFVRDTFYDELHRRYQPICKDPLPNSQRISANL